jgi:hypothetical protein
MWTSIEALVLACGGNLMIVTDGESFVAETLAFTFWGLFSQSFCDPANQISFLLLVPENSGDHDWAVKTYFQSHLPGTIDNRASYSQL